MKRLLANPGEKVRWDSHNEAGRVFYQNVSSIVELEDGRQVMMTQSYDITAIRERLMSLEKEKDDYLSRMSHEIFTPLNAITGLSKIAGSTDDIDKIKNCLSRINDASKRLLEIVNNIFEISKLEADLLEIVYDRVYIEQMLSGMCADLIAQICEKEQDFRVTIEKGTPSIIRTDQKRLTQILLQLLLNAIKFTPVGGTIRLNVSAAAGGDSPLGVAFSVSDNGIGIPDANMARLFDAYEQADGSKKRAYGGVGLGLAIARRLAILLGGDIRVESDQKSGSTFTLTIAADSECDAEYSNATRIVFGGDVKAGSGAGAPDSRADARAGDADRAEFGINGLNGVSGVNGLYGVNDVNGVNSLNGVNGVNGMNGVNGDIGKYDANGGANFEAVGDYESFYPVFDVAEALEKLKNIKKLYLAMLVTLKNNPLFGEMRDVMSKGDFTQIIGVAHNFIAIAQKLCMTEMLAVLERIETMAKRKVARPDLNAMFETAASNIFAKLDDLIDVMNREAKK
jgi:signal transduction histidine kinase